MAYASAADLALSGMPAASLSGVASEAQTEALAQASETIDSYLRARYTLPLSEWGRDIKRACVIIAVYDILTFRGYVPQGEDDNFRLRYLDVIKWLEAVRDGKNEPSGVVDATPEESEEGAYIVTEAPRGW